jgi:hypothetical protein
VSATFLGHPRGLATLFFTEMWERFTYYGMRAVLVLFLVSAVAQGGFGIDDRTATAIYGLYTAGVYLAALPGGWIADRLIGVPYSSGASESRSGIRFWRYPRVPARSTSACSSSCSAWGC